MADSQPVGAPVQAKVDSESEGEEEEVTETATSPDAAPTSEGGKKKKKKSKRAKLAAALGKTETGEGSNSKPAAKMSDSSIQTLLEMNPSLRGELDKMTPAQAHEVLKKMDVSQLMTGLSLTNKNQKDMASYKFWATQPVPRFDDRPSDRETKPDGPLQEVVPDKVPKTAAPLPEGYEWVELDLTNEAELKEVFHLLTYHYVEDDSATFRFNYSQPFLDWALKAPGWTKKWHIGVRAKGPSRLLVASIFGIPTRLRVRAHPLDLVEVNFLCIHKKLRGKRLAPVLIKEITRRIHLEGIYQAVYTGGVVLPTPVASCRYFHRSLDWSKLYDVGFSPLPPNTTKQRMIARNQLPDKTKTPGWRAMREQDIDAVMDLLGRYLKRFDMAQEFTRAEIEHWLVNRTTTADDRVVWAFVIEQDGRITDMVSFYSLESSVIGELAAKHDKVRAAYLFYYASELAFVDKEKGLKERLQDVVGDALIEAKKAGFDVFNALTLLDNPLFLEQLKFGAGDGQLHYYLYNWRTPPISGGVDKRNMPDEKMRGGVGLVML